MEPCVENVKAENLCPTNTSIEQNETKTANLSKKQQKKLARKMLFTSTKAERRAQEKAKFKKKRQENFEKKKLLNEIDPPKKRFKLMKDSTCKIKVVIDLSLDHLMTEHELLKAVKQIQWCYSENRISDNPVQLYLTSFCDKTKEVFSLRQGCLNWDVFFKEENYVDVFGKENIIYLTSESPNILSTLDESKSYVIGGLVDHNRHKGLCFKLAEEKGVSHARLPIDLYFTMKSRKVLTINHVFTILLGVSAGSSWEESLQKALPSRKGALPINITVDKELSP